MEWMERSSFEPRTASIYPVKKPKKARGPSMATSTSGLTLEPMAQTVSWLSLPQHPSGYEPFSLGVVLIPQQHPQHPGMT